MYVTMVFHHPVPEHREAMLTFMYEIERAMEGTPGLLGIDSLRDLDAERLVAIGRWESEAAATEGIPRLLAVGGRDPGWTDRPDELFRLQT